MSENATGRCKSIVDNTFIEFSGHHTEVEAKTLDKRLTFMYGNTWLHQETHRVNGQWQVAKRYIPSSLSASLTHRQTEIIMENYDPERFNYRNYTEAYLQVRTQIQ
jgi:hypothetical protein